MGLRAFIAFEVGAFAVSYASFCYLRRRESARRTLYEKLPLALDLYYKSEDAVSFGQQVGSRLRSVKKLCHSLDVRPKNP